MTAFDDLENAINEGTEKPSISSSSSESGASEESQTSNESHESHESKTSEEPKDPRETPAFEFSPDLRRSIYTREESWQELEDARDLEMTRELRDAGVRNHESREVHDAMVRLAAENPEKMAQLILDARGVDEEQ
ncbi:hypothetical protein ZOD2009_15761 [Haladaptatus paucihalophilus DX253]|uniref:Uncharacterized protein n=1 Tax=Haladaptatus paucihalophilus DX253 TaxID=797209 RepID=E7QWG4_HALPU|nr:hypothetical protein [Haladaptatus paucihalophilus]EFW91060.1 hypothetical protein ZOD2009_15761 [Haladaptatus paucihalophilus DX253]